MNKVRTQVATTITTITPTSYSLEWKGERPNEHLLTVKFEHDGHTYVQREQYSGEPTFELPLYPVGEPELGEYVEVVLPWAKEVKK
jgi:hypothetical protein